ncbi:MAG: class I SAM-dependent methyltransferase [Gemmataceae bacterium]|nr:class I SAM-dependent methyltransferase [Gemmataceae bacterium]
MAKGRESGMPDAGSWGTFFNPECIVGRLDCAGHLDVVEFGCGYGLFTVPAARAVTGTVYALDIDPDMVAATAALAARNGLSNVRAEERDFLAHGSGRPDASAGYAMLFNILHVEEPVSLLREAYRTLAPGGRAGVIHWKHDPATPRGPSLAIRPTAEQCRTWAESAGLRFLRGEDLCCCSWHWGMVLERPSS